MTKNTNSADIHLTTIPDSEIADRLHETVYTFRDCFIMDNRRFDLIHAETLDEKTFIALERTPGTPYPPYRAVNGEMLIRLASLLRTET